MSLNKNEKSFYVRNIRNIRNLSNFKSSRLSIVISRTDTHCQYIQWTVPLILKLEKFRILKLNLGKIRFFTYFLFIDGTEYHTLFDGMKYFSKISLPFFEKKSDTYCSNALFSNMMKKGTLFRQSCC